MVTVQCRMFCDINISLVAPQKDLSVVTTKYGVARGVVQGLQDRCARYAGMLSAFCSRMGWNDMEILLAKFQCRLLHGARPELLGLMEIPFVKAHTARLLSRVGFRTVEDLATVSDVDGVTTAILGGRGSKEEDRRVAKVQAARIVRSAKEMVQQKVRVGERP